MDSWTVNEIDKKKGNLIQGGSKVMMLILRTHVEIIKITQNLKILNSFGDLFY